MMKLPAHPGSLGVDFFPHFHKKVWIFLVFGAAFFVKGVGKSVGKSGWFEGSGQQFSPLEKQGKVSLVSPQNCIRNRLERPDFSSGNCVPPKRPKKWMFFVFLEPFRSTRFCNGNVSFHLKNPTPELHLSEQEFCFFGCSVLPGRQIPC